MTWAKGEKHPDTPRAIFKNCYEYDRIRKILPARCRICDFVVSRDELAVREVIFKCEDTSCCGKLIASKPHQVCNLCYDMHHALYLNPGMRNMNYFKEIDEKIKSDYDNFKRGQRNL